MSEYVTKDSGERKTYASNMVRDTDEGKPLYTLLRSSFIPREETMFHREAMLMTRGAQKYGKQNWELADSVEELERFKESACRHFEQWLSGEVDEDHAAAIRFNVRAYEEIKAKMVR